MINADIKEKIRNWEIAVIASFFVAGIGYGLSKVHNNPNYFIGGIAGGVILFIILAAAIVFRS